MTNLYNYDALAYRRFRWKGVPDEIGDVERILTWWDGHSVLTDDGKLLPVQAATGMLEPFKGMELAPIGSDNPEDSALYPWSRLICVAPARKIITVLKNTMEQLDDAQIKLSMLAKITRAVQQADETSGDVSQIVNGIYEGAMPAITVSAKFTGEKVIQIGDGETHAQGVSDMHLVALSRACQALGIRMDAVIKRERVVTNETETTRDLVDIIRENEINERQRLAAWTGWELEVLI